MSIIRKVLDFYRDPEYFSEVKKIAVPIIIQQLMFSGLNLLGVIFVGQKGDASVAAVGLACQVAFLLNLVHFGIISSAAMFTAQFWGRRDVPNLRRVLGLCLMLALSASLIFFTLAQFFPSQILHIYSNDAAVIKLGTSYIRTFSWTFIFFAITFSYSFVLRSTGDVRTPNYLWTHGNNILCGDEHCQYHRAGGVCPVYWYFQCNISLSGKPHWRREGR